VTEISGMQSGKLSSEKYYYAELNKHLLHEIANTAEFFIIGRQEEERFYQKCKWFSIDQ
jgi:hypothetical protein